MKKILAALIILPLAAFGGVKGYAWYQVKQSMDELVIAARPFATVTYEGIGTSLSGRVSIEDINIASPAITGDLRIQEIAISAPDLPSLLNMDEKLKTNQLPDWMGLEIKHLRIPAEALASMQSSESAANQSMDVVYAIGCGDLERIGLDEMVEMGYANFDVSLNVTVEKTGVQNIVKTVTDVNWHGGGNLTMTARLPDARGMGQLLASDVPPSVSVRIDNARFHEKLIAFCAGKTEMESSDYVEHHVNLIRERLQASGIELSESLYTAYQRYLGEGAPITIGVSPDDMASLANIAQYKPRDIPAVIGLELKVGDEYIDYDFALNKRKKETSVAMAKEPVEESQPARTKTPVPTNTRRAYVPVDKTALGEHLNGTVKVETVTGRRFTGRLLQASDTSIQLSVRLGGGAATIPIQLSDIDSVQVYQ